MNRMRLMVLSGFVVLGSLGALSAEAQSVGGNTTYAPRYYAANGGYFSGGYYFAPGPAPTYAAPRYTAPASVYRAPAPRAPMRSNDVTGRHDGLARPWLQPLR